MYIDTDLVRFTSIHRIYVEPLGLLSSIPIPLREQIFTPNSGQVVINRAKILHVVGPAAEVVINHSTI